MALFERDGNMKHNYYNPYYDDNEYISAQGPEPDDALSEKYPLL